MINLNEMKAKELKEMAKQLKVKDWWNLKKEDLIAEIAIAIGDKEDEGEDVDVEALAQSAADEETATEPKVKEVKKPSLKIKELTFDGRTQTIKEWAEELEMPWPTLYDRINRNGWTVEEALTIPLGGRRKKNKEEA